MPVQNTDVADIFNKLADLLDIQGDNPFRIRAYRNAARTISSLPRRISDMAKANEDLTRLPGIGKEISEKIKEIVETGYLSKLQKMERDSDGDLTEMLTVASLGPKRVKKLFRDLGIRNLKGLKAAAEMGKIRQLEGFGIKTEKRILDELKHRSGKEHRIKLIEAEQRAEPLVAYLKLTNGVKDIIIAGSFRRREETIGDLDILATCKKGTKIMDRFVGYEDVSGVLSKGSTRSTVKLRSGLQVDLRVLPEVSCGAALHYFTGSKNHNIAIRKLGIAKQYKINEYGVFSGSRRIGGRTETEVFNAVGLPYIEPELRQNRGEIEAAFKGELPDLVRVQDLRGDMHTHTIETDGHNSLEEMADAARELGYQYLAITNHSKRVTVAKGLDENRLWKLIKDIDRLNGKLNGIILLKGIEVDILKDGSLDLSDEALKELDVTVCSVHYHHNLSGEQQTERILRAMDNPYFNILAHPTGRLINERKPYDVDMEKIMNGARDRGCFLEINAHPDRLDLSDMYCKMAKDINLKVVISTDAHRATDLAFMRFGVDQARRGWLEAEDVLNTRPWKEVNKLLKRK